MEENIQFRFFSKWRSWGFDEKEARTKFETRQRQWAYRTLSSYKSIIDYGGTVSIAKQKQYETACRIVMVDALIK